MATITFHPEGAKLTDLGNKRQFHARRTGGDNGVTHFSDSSKRNLRNRIQSIDWDATLATAEYLTHVKNSRIVMGTLTVGDDYTGDVSKSLTQLKARFKTAFGMPLTGVWVKEHHHREAGVFPHVHIWFVLPNSFAFDYQHKALSEWKKALKVWNRFPLGDRPRKPRVTRRMSAERWLQAAWSDITGASKIHGAKISEFEEFSPKATALYATKTGAFKAKSGQQKGVTEGRYWGVMGDVVELEIDALDISDDLVNEYRRLVGIISAEAGRYVRLSPEDAQAVLAQAAENLAAMEEEFVEDVTKDIEALCGFTMVSEYDYDSLTEDDLNVSIAFDTEIPPEE